MRKELRFPEVCKGVMGPSAISGNMMHPVDGNGSHKVWSQQGAEEVEGEVGAE